MNVSLKNNWDDIRQNEQVKSMQSKLTQKQGNQKLKAACEDFEAVFVNMLFKQMRKTVTESDFLGNSREEKLFKEMLDENLSTEIAKSGAFGIGKMLYNQLQVKT